MKKALMLAFLLAVSCTLSFAYGTQYAITEANYEYEIVEQENKTLYLHNNSGEYILNTTKGSSEETTNYTINTDAYRAWTQKPSFAGSFNIVNICTAHLFIEPINDGAYWPDVTVNMTYNDDTWLDTETIGDISTTSWYNFTLHIDRSAVIVHYNKNITLNISASSEGGAPSIKVYYDSATRDSRLNLTTSTYVDVDWIKTYNGGIETSEFGVLDVITVKANISDPIGSYDITEAKITIRDPNGDDVVTNATMTLEQIDPSDPSAWKRFTYDAGPYGTTGTYSVFVFGHESNGVSSYKTTTFTVS
ncbi:MAG: hypothetical protein E3J35_01860 [Methanomassiliicoccales archaeon]|nr:MAG: hypothetical protein E3J35_01860 [Methanomassiliicoccales archaeon]